MRRSYFSIQTRHALLGITIVVAAGIFGVCTKPAEAAVITWDGGGATNNWSEDQNWSGDVEPGTSDIATFSSTSTKAATIDANISVAGIDINSGYTGIITQGAGFTVTVGTSDFDISDGTFTGGDSTITMNDAFTVSGGTFTSTTGTLIFDGAVTISSGSFDPNGGSVTFQGTTFTTNVNVTETFNNVTFSMNASTTMTITSGDTLVVGGTLTLTEGFVGTGAIEAQGDITQGANFDGGTATIDFGGAGAQTYTINGGTGPVVELDEAADASDSITFAAAGRLEGLTITSGFSGTIPISNASDFQMTFTAWTQAAGTFSGGSFSNFRVNDLVISGGTFTAPTTVTFIENAATLNVNSTQTFDNLTSSLNNNAGLTVGSGDTITVTGTLTQSDGTISSAGGGASIKAQGSTITIGAGADGGNCPIDFDDAGAQTLTNNGGAGGYIRLDSSDDASDSIVFAAAGSFSTFETTAGFSGTIPISNAGDYTMSFTTWTQAAGTFDGSSFSNMAMQDMTTSGGTFNAPTTMTFSSLTPSWDLNSTQTVNNLTLSTSASGVFALGSNDTLTITGTLTMNDGGANNGTMKAQGAIAYSSNFDGGSTIVDFDAAGAQTLTIGGGAFPVLRFDSSADASDSVTVTATARFAGLTTTSDFTGTVPLTNSGDNVITFDALTLGGGTLDLSASSSIVLGDFTQTGSAVLSAPALVTWGGQLTPSYTVDSTVTFIDVTVNATGGGSFAIASGDTMIVSDDYVCTNGTLAAAGTLEVQGDVTFDSTCDSESTPLVLSGGGTQVVADNTSGNSIFNGDLTINKSGGQVNLSTAFVMNQANSDLTIAEGTLNLAGNNLTVNGTSGTMVVQDGGNFQLQGGETITLNASNPTLSSGSTVTYTGDGDAASDTYTVTTLEDVYHHLVINSTDGATDTFQLGAALDVNGNLTVTAGTFDVSASNYAITLAGNWSNSGTFNGRSGTVALDADTNHTVSGATTWYNLTLQNTTDDTTDVTVTFQSSVTQTIGGALTLDGLDGNDRLLIAASTGGQEATIVFSGSSTFTGDYLLITDNTVTDSSSGVTLPLDPANSTNGGNTSGWFASTFGGTVYSDEGVTNIGANITIRLLHNGADTGVTGNTDASGVYSLDISALTLVSGDVMTVYMDDETENGVTVTRYDSGSVASLDIYQNFLIVQHEDAGPITNTNLDTANNADPGVSSDDISSIYTVSGGTLSTASSSVELLVHLSDTFTPGGAIDAAGNIDINGTLNAEANAVNIAGSFDNGGTFTHTGTLTFDGTSAQTVVAGGSAIGSDVVIANTSAPVSLSTNAFDIGANDLTINSSAILSLAGQNLTASGTFSNSGTVRLRGSETVSVTQDTNSGTFEYVGDADSASDTFTLTDFGATDYYNLTIATTDSGDTVQSGAAKSIAGTLTITSGTYGANANTTSVTGLTTVSGGTYLASTTTQTLTGLTISGGTFTGSSGTVDVNGTVTLSSGTLTSPTSLTIQGDFTDSGGTFNAGSGTVTFDADANHTISGSNSWRNLTLQNTTNDATDAILTIEASSSQTVTGVLTFDGLDGDDRVNIVSSSPGTAAVTVFSGSSTFSGDYLDITDNTVTDNSTGITLPINPANTVNGGNAGGWFLATFDGIVYTNEAVTELGAGRTVRLLQNGSDTGLTADTNASSIYSIDVSSLALNPGDVLTFYLDDETENGVTVMRYDAVTVGSINIYQNYLILRHEDSGPITNSNLDTADNVDPGASANDISSIYSVSAGTLTTGNAIELLITSGDTFTPGGAVDANGTIDIDGTLNAEANAINAARDFDNAGTFTHTGTLTFDGTSIQTVKPGGSAIGSDVVIANTNAAVSLSTNALDIGANNLTINSSAILSLAGQSLTASGTFENSGTLRLQGDETLTLTQDVNSGTVEYKGDGSGGTATFTLIDFGATDYYNLTIAASSSADTIQSGAAKVVAGTMAVSSGTYNANSNTTTVAGTTTVSGGTYTAGSATQTFAALTVSGGTFTGSSGTVDVNGTLTLSSGTLTAPSGSMTIQGNFTNSGGTFTHNSGSVTLDADANHTISGSNSWNNLTLLDSADNATNVVLTVESGTTQTINGILTLDGLDASDMLELVASSTGTETTTAFAGTSTFSGDYLDITDNTATSTSSGVTLPITPSNSTNSGNADGWFRSTSGTTGYVGGNAPAEITLEYPNGGEVLNAGDQTFISWTSSGTGATYVDISLSVDGGLTYETVIEAHANNGFYVWTVPDISTNEARIKIDGTDLAVIATTDVSDDNFTIVGTVTESDEGDGEDDEGDDSGSGEGVDTVEPYSYIKGRSFADVYFVDEHLNRHPIFNESIYFTYNDSWGVVQIVSDATLPTLAIKSVVLPKPGVVLVKVQSVPHVYAVFEGADGSTELRWIRTEEIATAMYGEDWADYVIDIPPTFWTKFTFGEDIDVPISVDLSIMKKRWELVE